MSLATSYRSLSNLRFRRDMKGSWGSKMTTMKKRKVAGAKNLGGLNFILFQVTSAHSMRGR
ncbi:hypothetical protein Mp_3g18810 [Marchantia polymorpha subsp. ruderalis]|uniref:Uncharacterized protein n=2 Tax=Marchantia polymorpha TaxID=3197 RepID=A0AAF6B2B7_MARPO|nr:hypothetical protein MARPO_0142s0014 [Marchantia polymorpha]BBN06151.1 hypothetical protein Mp_3g18810 [Marchantia polymorpha subsp. ruderalis]|eukprot:PTQ29383.1 hypothetical protein MARPO_0142s0014 [Marchantia polymorpha]